ncbi:hypothetical protein CGRA01v4_05398 [Colletotrichum graminicola]|nr:hypothetical protein CGRA01v4_05398 [Colletotrichum graminicola]
MESTWCLPNSICQPCLRPCTILTIRLPGCRLSAVDTASTGLCPGPGWCSRWSPIPAVSGTASGQADRQTGIALPLLLPVVPSSAPSGVAIRRMSLSAAKMACDGTA